MTAEELYKKDEDITGEGYIYKHTFELDGIRNNLGCNGVKLVLSQDNALKSVEMARKEEREKAMDAFDKVLSNMTYHISRGEDYGNIYQKFKELLNK